MGLTIAITACVFLFVGLIAVYKHQSKVIEDLKNDLSTASTGGIESEVAAREAINKSHQLSLDNEKLEIELESQLERNSTIISQKKSSETRLGQISEQLVPFLTGFNRNPKNLHFIGNPIDYIHFDFDQGEITFIEIKSGNSRATKRQRTIKNIIKNGLIFYEEVRVNEKGVTTKKAINE